MKRSNVAMIVLIASISIMVSFFAVRAFFGETATENAKVKTIERIDATIVEPDTSIFNKDAINPAVEVQVGSGSQ